MATKKQKAQLVEHISPTLSSSDAVSRLKERLAGLSTVPDGPEMTGWSNTTRAVVAAAFGSPSRQVSEFDRAGAVFGSVGIIGNPGATARMQAQNNQARRARHAAAITSFIETLALGLGPSPLAGAGRETVISAAELKPRLAFLNDDRLFSICARDLLELEDALAREAWKSSLLLCGSILEAVLLDVVGRRSDLAAPYLKKRRFPDDASLGDLIAIAGDYDLLSTIAKGLAGTITEHRDLIHPHAEVRGGMKVDKTTARALAHVLDLVTRDLADAETRGAIDAYVNK